MREVKILYGIRTNDMADIKQGVREELARHEIEVISDEHRDIKAGIQHEIETRYAKDDALVLVVSYRLDNKNEPFTMGEFVNYQKTLPNIRIIVIVSVSDRGVFKDFFTNGIYDAIIDEDVDIRTLSDLIAEGRTVTEARNYYKIDKDTTAAEKITFDSAYRVITQPLNGAPVSEYVVRTDWARVRLPEQEFATLLDKLPDEIKSVLAETDTYAKFYEEFINSQLNGLRFDNGAQTPTEYSGVDPSLLRDVLANVLRRSMIAVASAQPHVGSTHNAIAIAHFLSEKGFKVGIVEYADQENHAFRYMAEEQNFKIKNGKFRWKEVDYYPEFSFKDLARLNGGGYNFIVVDFGLLTQEKLYDFTSCVTQNIVTGSRIWETVKLDDVFKMIEKSLLVNCNFLFYSTPPAAKIAIAKKMAPLKVYHIDYDIDPFDGEVSGGIAELFDDFVLTKNTPEKKKKWSLFGR